MQFNGLTDQENEMLERIFTRWHVDYIEPTEQNIAQAAFDIGVLHGLVDSLSERLRQLDKT